MSNEFKMSDCLLGFGHGTKICCRSRCEEKEVPVAGSKFETGENSKLNNANNNNVRILSSHTVSAHHVRIMKRN